LKTECRPKSVIDEWPIAWRQGARWLVGCDEDLSERDALSRQYATLHLLATFQAIG
jgi:hypothetical protein